MQIVISIPKEYYKIRKSIENGSMVSKMILNSFKNGIPLPEGHGVLKDVDVIKKSWNGINTPCGIRKVIDLQVIDDAPTIVEADKEGENAD